MLTLGHLFDWFTEQARIILMFVLILVVLTTAFRREWLGMVASLIGILFIGIFIINPHVIIDLSKWLANMVTLK